MTLNKQLNEANKQQLKPKPLALSQQETEGNLVY